MFLLEIEKPVTSRTINNVLKEQFNYDLLSEKLNDKIARKIFSELCRRIETFRDSKNYYISENNREYLSLLSAARFLHEYLIENRILVEKDPRLNRPPVVKNSNTYRKGTTHAIKHGVDTGVKFVPHVAGSALGAFVGGLKGQALQSDAGKIKVTNFEQELEAIDPKNPAKLQGFFDKQMKEHFSEYKIPEVRKGITDFMNTIYRAGLAGKTLSPAQIDKSLTTIVGNPFKTVTDQKVRNELVKYFYEIYEGAKKKATKDREKPNVVVPGIKQSMQITQIMKDTASAFENLGYGKKNAQIAVQQAVEKNPALMNDFNALFLATQPLIAKK